MSHNGTCNNSTNFTIIYNNTIIYSSTISILFKQKESEGLDCGEMTQNVTPL